MSRLSLLLAPILLLGLAACGASDHGYDHGDGGHAHADDDHGHGEDDHGHGHGGGVVVTDFTGTAELFVEFPPLAVGRDSPFAAHFTRLDTFAPVAEGEAIVRLSGGGVGEEVFRADPSATAGIFRPVVTPRSAARRRVTVELVTGDLTSVHDLGEYQVFRSVDEADASLPEEAEDETLIPFLKEQQWKVEFGTAPVETETLARSVSAPGTLTVSPNSEARVAATADGLVSAPSGGFPDLGAEVRSGDILARITPRLGGDLDRASLDAERASAEAALEAARAERVRLEALLTDGAVPQRRVDEALTLERQAEARFNAAESRAQAAGGSSGVLVRAPIDGRVVEINITPGAFVSSGDLLFHILDDDQMRLVARVAEADMARLGSPQGAFFRIAGADTVHDLDALGGRLISARAGIDPVTRTAPVVFEFDNPDGALRSGASVTAGVRTSETFTGPVIPATALIDDAGQDVVFVMADGENWERRVVTIALRDGGRVGIASGLEAGERVVSRGAYLVHLAATGPAEAGHGHAH
ncbi:MAG: efflux RND transporter periplasmic adaptor subunit [Hyphomonadaceae bacterium]|nr:efflux RND transporter periplasmic adaptor subunit [Hyphomonadaceae bacterium]